jgi:hypothetical protein
MSTEEPDNRQGGGDQDEITAAAAEAAAIGGSRGGPEYDASEAGVREGGGGESEGFEEAELELIEHASHGGEFDEEDIGELDEDDDFEYSSELGDEDYDP